MIGLEIGIRMVYSAWEALHTFESGERKWWFVGGATGHQAGMSLSLLEAAS